MRQSVLLPPLKGEGDRAAVEGSTDRQEAPARPLSLASLASSPFRGAETEDADRRTTVKLTAQNWK